MSRPPFLDPPGRTRKRGGSRRERFAALEDYVVLEVKGQPVWCQRYGAHPEGRKMVPVGEHVAVQGGRMLCIECAEKISGAGALT